MLGQEQVFRSEENSEHTVNLKVAILVHVAAEAGHVRRLCSCRCLLLTRSTGGQNHRTDAVQQYCVNDTDRNHTLR
jgi:hypothetical protein